MSAIEDVRKAMQDFLAPELRGLAAKLDALAETQKETRDELKEGQREMEVRLLREIKAAEERLSLKLEVAQLTVRNAELQQRLAAKESPAGTQ